MTTASEPTATDAERTNADRDVPRAESSHETTTSDPEVLPSRAAPFPYAETDSGSRLDSRPVAGVLHSSDGHAILEGTATCPDCGDETINGAGLFTCSSCEWSGSLR